MTIYTNILLPALMYTMCVVCCRPMFPILYSDLWSQSGTPPPHPLRILLCVLIARQVQHTLHSSTCVNTCLLTLCALSAQFSRRGNKRRVVRKKRRYRPEFAVRPTAVVGFSELITVTLPRGPALQYYMCRGSRWRASYCALYTIGRQTRGYGEGNRHKQKISSPGN